MADDFTAKFRVDISDLKSGISEATKQIKLANATFKAETAGMDKWSKDADGLSAKLRQLEKVLESQKSILSAYRQQLERQQQAYDENGKRAEELKKKLNDLAANGVAKTDEEYKKYEAALKSVLKEQANNEKASDDLKLAILEQEAAIGKTEKEIRNYGSELGKLEGSLDDADEETEDLAESTEDAGDAAEKAANGGFSVLKGALANLVAQGISKAVSGLKNLAKGALEAGIGFESSMSNVAALSGATGEELELLNETAKKFGATTQFSASEAADALGYMALAGWDAEKSAAELGGVLDLAAASGMDLAAASDMVTDYLSAFSNSTITATDFANKLAYAQANSNTSATQLGEAYKNTAAVMNAAGQSVEVTTALLASMANQGLKGGEAGTALAAVMRDMTNKTISLSNAVDIATWKQSGFSSSTGDLNDLLGKNAIAIGRTLIPISDANGNYRDMLDILGDVQAATDGLGSSERAVAMSATFGAVAMKGLNLVFNEGIDSAIDMSEALIDCDGAAGEMAKTMNDNLSGDVKSMQSAFEGLQLTIYDLANGALRTVVQSVTSDLLPAITDFVKGVEGSGKRIGNAVGKIANTIIGSLTRALPEIIDMGFTLIVSLIEGLLSALPELVKSGATIIVNLINGLSSALPKIWQLVATVIPEAIRVLISQLPMIVQSLVSAIPQLLQGAISFFMAIVDAIPIVLQSLLEALPSIIQTILGSISEWLPMLIDGAISLLMSIVDAIPVIIPMLIEALPTIISTIINCLIEALPVILDGAITLFMALIEALPVIILALVDELPRLVEMIVSILLDNLPVLLQGAITLFMALVQAIPEIVIQLVKSLPTIITAFINGLIGPLKGLFKGLWDGIKNLAKGALDGIKNLWSAIPGWFREKIDSIKNFFKGMWDGLKNGAKQAWQGVKDVFGGIADWFKNIFKNAWQKVKDVFSAGGKVFEGIKDGIVNAFKTVVNAIIRGINKVISIPFNAINAIFRKLKGISILGIKPFGWLNEFNVPQIPELRRGGVLKKGQVGLLEGDGAEAVVPLDQNKKWIRAVANDLLRALRVDVGSTSAAAVAASGASASSEYNFTQIINAPKSPSRYDIYRQTRNLLAYARGED